MIALIVAAGLGNFWAPSVVPGVRYLPGSACVLLAVTLLGPRRALAVAAVSVAPLLLPEAVGFDGGALRREAGLAAVLLLEPLVVGLGLRWLSRGNLFLADALFWLGLGGPLVWLLTAGPVGSPVPLAELAALYQVLVGLTNALMAGLLLSLTPLTRWAGLPQWRLPFQAALFQFAGGTALTLTLVLLTLTGRSNLDEVDGKARRAITAGFYAVEQQVAQRLSGRSLTEAQAAQRLSEILVAEAGNRGMNLVYADPQGRVLASTYPWHRRWELRRLLRAAPEPDRQQSASVTRIRRPALSGFRDWVDADYRAVRPLTLNTTLGDTGGDSGGMLLLEYPLAPLMAELYRDYRQTLLAGLSMLLAGLAVTWWLSRRVVAPLRALEEEAAQLPNRLHDEGQAFGGRESRIQEVASLTDSVREMDRRLRYEFGEALKANRKLVQANRRLELEVQERRMAQAALAESEGRFRQWAEHLRHGVFWMSSADGRQLLYVSPNFERIWGRSVEALYADWPRSMLDAMHPEDRPDMECLMREERGVEREVDLEYRIVRPDGTIRWIRSIGFPIYNEAGLFYQYGGISIDITPQKAAEERVREHQSELAHMARLSLASEMSSGLAHELNQPLAAISTYASALQERVRNGRTEPEAMQSVLERIVGQAARGGDIIRRLRTLVRKSAPQCQPECLNALVRRVVELTAHELRDQQVRVRFDLHEELPPVPVDAIQVEQVVLNLIRNAVDALRAVPVGEREITVRTVAEGEHVAVEVADRGPGIPESVMESLFQPFETTKEKGMGVGLWISRSLIQGHQGDLAARNRPEGGAVFTVTLPRTEGQSVPSATGSGARGPRHTPRSTARSTSKSSDRAQGRRTAAHVIPWPRLRDNG